jgi:hypothetical protein
VRHTSRSNGLLQRKASLARVFPSALKTGRDVMTGGARDIIMKVALS